MHYMANDMSTQWHLDKRVPIAMIAAIMLQGGAIVWWASTTFENHAVRIGVIEKWITSNERLDARMSVIESNQAGMKEQIDELKDIARRIEDAVVMPPHNGHPD